MNDLIKKDIINLINEALSAISKKDITLLKEISDHTIHNSATSQDDASISIAVVVYSLYKIFNNPSLTHSKKWERFSKDLVLYLGKAKEGLERDDLSKYNSSISLILKSMSKIESQLGQYIFSVINSAKVKKGTKLYEHGISASRAAQILGISSWDLMSYMGNVSIPETERILTKKTKERLESARRLFEI
ncbi:MAG: hypothetical protein PHT54_03030 [Candidatus Nanoarchaeia archaeon]|nr:hypothetical protein [Candidatus Nanoarchaeia archaeon]